MKNYFLFYCILVSAFTSCGVIKKENSREECTLASAIDKAKSRAEKKGLRLNQYNISFARHEKAYLIVFSLIEIADGGGAEITISKDSHVIINEKYYQ